MISMAKQESQRNKRELHLFIDANVLIDIDDMESANHHDANNFLQIALQQNIPLSISAISIVFYAYTIGKIKSRQQIHTTILGLESAFNILPLNSSIILKANKMNTADFEDAVQYSSASEQSNITHIVTSDKHFVKADIPVISLVQAIAIISS
jgi:predicted nucleic acid-binding protein